MKVYRIMCIGPQWRGSNANALFKAFARAGHLIHIVDENYYINLSSFSKKTKVVNKLTRKLFVSEFNKAIVQQAKIFNPDIVLVYKGAFVEPETLQVLKQRHKKIFNFYPDVSFMAHGSLLPLTMPLYDHIFTTKTFGIDDLKNKFNYTRVTFVPHGFDPDIHRKMKLDPSSKTIEASFIGTYSPGKSQTLLYLKQQLTSLDLKIYGGRWNEGAEQLKNSVMGYSIMGDIYPYTIQLSKINLGLLSEIVYGASSGDMITSRTFHIPASYGFMIHKRTEELLQYFKEDHEVVCYDSNEELVDKVKFYLANEKNRLDILNKGYERCINEHSIDHRAKVVLQDMYRYL